MLAWLTRPIYPELGRVAQLLRGGSWNNNPKNCRSANRNHNQPDNANNTIGFRVVCLPQHPSQAEPVEGIPSGDQEGSRPAPVINRLRLLIRTAPEGAPPAHGSPSAPDPRPSFRLSQWGKARRCLIRSGPPESLAEMVASLIKASAFHLLEPWGETS